MGFFSQLDIEVMEMVQDNVPDQSIVDYLFSKYNGNVSKETLQETVDAVHFGDYDWSPWDNAG